MSRLIVNQIQAKTGGEIEIPSGQTIRNNGTAVGFGLSTATDTLPSEGGAATTIVAQGLAKHFINFNGNSTVATRDSFNNSGLTDNGTGDYTPAFTNAFSNTNYIFTQGAHYGSTNGGRFMSAPHNDEMNTGSIRINAADGDPNTALDLKYCMAMHHGDLA